MLLILLWLPVLMTATALAMDGGQLFLTRIRLQSAVDLAALAAVQSLDWDRLADGELVLLEGESEDAVRDYLHQNLISFTNDEPVGVWVWVVNAHPGDPGIHPITGEEILYPTVIVRCEVRAPRSLLRSWDQGPVLRAEADASIRPRND